MRFSIGRRTGGGGPSRRRGFGGHIELPDGVCGDGEMVLVGLLGLSHSLRLGAKDDPARYMQPWWWISAGISVFLVLFAGIMSGLTLGLMSLGLMDLDVLQQSGTDEEKEQACMFPFTVTIRIFSPLVFGFQFRLSFVSFSTRPGLSLPLMIHLYI